MSASLPPSHPVHHLVSSSTITHGRCACGEEVPYDGMAEHIARAERDDLARAAGLIGGETVTEPDEPYDEIEAGLRYIRRVRSMLPSERVMRSLDEAELLAQRREVQP